MRYAFMMKDLDLNEKYVVKIPKDVNPVTYNFDDMQKEIEAMIICKHIVSEFNDKIITLLDARNLVEFVHPYIYEILDEGAPFKYYYGENFIDGKYNKFNNNAGWILQNSNQSLIAQCLSHFSW